MSEKVLCEKSDLVAIADAVREATGSTENYNVSELSAATVEAISAGGSGGSVETCTVTLNADVLTTIYYTSPNGYVVNSDASSGATFEVYKDTIVYCITNSPSSIQMTGSVTTIYNSYYDAIVVANGDFAISKQESSEPDGPGAPGG